MNKKKDEFIVKQLRGKKRTVIEKIRVEQKKPIKKNKGQTRSYSYYTHTKKRILFNKKSFFFSQFFLLYPLFFQKKDGRNKHTHKTIKRNVITLHFIFTNGVENIWRQKKEEETMKRRIMRTILWSKQMGNMKKKDNQIY